MQSQGFESSLIQNCDSSVNLEYDCVGDPGRESSFFAAGLEYMVKVGDPMNLIDYFRRQFAYNEWANREVLAALRASREASTRPVQLVAHVLSAERLWLERLTQQPQSLPVWPQLILEHCEEQASALVRLWREYLDAKLDLARSVSYKNSKGEPWTSTIQDILTHVLMHSAYHRGQIASHMRASGQTPPYTDFIHCVRQGLIE